VEGVVEGMVERMVERVVGIEGNLGSDRFILYSFLYKYRALLNLDTIPNLFAAAAATTIARGRSVTSKIEAIHNFKDQYATCMELDYDILISTQTI
jgi:hypothetical protein